MDIIINFLAEILDFIIDFFLTFIEGAVSETRQSPNYRSFFISFIFLSSLPGVTNLNFF